LRRTLAVLHKKVQKNKEDNNNITFVKTNTVDLAQRLGVTVARIGEVVDKLVELNVLSMASKRNNGLAHNICVNTEIYIYIYWTRNL